MMDGVSMLHVTFDLDNGLLRLSGGHLPYSTVHGGRNGEDGVSVGVAVCFDEYSNGGDHGISIFYNGEALFEDLAPCENQEGCEPVSLFNDGAWHVVRVEIVPAEVGGGAQVVVKLDPVAGLSYGRTVGCKAQDSSLSTLSFAGCTHVLTRL
jgi:hypothetical protein